jgi:hypothetical protein
LRRFFSLAPPGESCAAALALHCLSGLDTLTKVRPTGFVLKPARVRP